MEFKNKIIIALTVVIISLVCFIFFTTQKEIKPIQVTQPEVSGLEDRSGTTILTLDKKLSDFFEISQNTKSDGIGFYPDTIELFGTSTVAKRIKTLLVNNGVYDEVVKNFNVVGALESVPKHEGVYHIIGCKVHNCPSYQIHIYFDLNNNNINIVIEHESTKMFEKGPIPVSWILGE